MLVVGFIGARCKWWCSFQSWVVTSVVSIIPCSRIQSGFILWYRRTQSVLGTLNQCNRVFRIIFAYSCPVNLCLLLVFCIWGLADYCQLDQVFFVSSFEVSSTFHQLRVSNCPYYWWIIYTVKQSLHCCVFLSVHIYYRADMLLWTLMLFFPAPTVAHFSTEYCTCSFLIFVFCHWAS